MTFPSPASPRIVVKLLKPDTGGHMARIFSAFSFHVPLPMENADLSIAPQTYSALTYTSFLYLLDVLVGSLAGGINVQELYAVSCHRRISQALSTYLQ